jgi:putative CRISPR-associated protein (TIGR02619 family)
METCGNLICTVGTSLLFPNLKHLDPETRFQKPPRPGDFQEAADQAALERAGLLGRPAELKKRLRCIKDAHEAADYATVADLFTGFPPELRLLGAEINSIEAMVRKKYLPDDRSRLILLVSDTADGRAIGTILRRYFLHPDCPVGFCDCIVEKVEGLQDEKPLIFQKEGLPNLVRLLGEHYRKWGSAIAINATGGYKAQIALAVAFGQASGVPVFYKHERFDQIIRFPKIPFSLDLSFLRNHLKFWADLAEPGASLDQDGFQRYFGDDEQIRESILSLLEWVDEDSVRLYQLSALGMVYWEAFRSLNPDLTLEPANTVHRAGCRLRDDHYPKGFRQYVQTLYDAFPRHVTACHSLPYDGQASIQQRFLVRDKRIVGEYLDRNRFGARFAVVTTAENELERKWLVEAFHRWTGRAPGSPGKGLEDR